MPTHQVRNCTSHQQTSCTLVLLEPVHLGLDPNPFGLTSRTFAVVSIPATRADQQTLQEIACASLANACSLLVFLQLVLDRFKELLADNGWNRNAQPLFPRNILDGDGSFRLQRPSSLGAQSWSQ